MPTRTISNTGGNWNVLATWVEGAVPTSSDDVVATGTSGNLTINVSAACRSIDLTTYVGTLVQSAALAVGDASGGALKFVAGMTYTRSTSFVISFVSTSNNGGTGWSVDFAGKTTSPITFNGAGGKWVLQSALAMTGVPLTLLNGTLDTGSFAITASSFISGTGTRTLTPGSSTITLTGSSTIIWNISASTTMTISANTATVVVAASITTPSVLGGLVDHNGMSFSMVTTGTLTIGSAAGLSGFICANLTRTATASLNNAIEFSADMTITGTLTLNGNSVVNRLRVGTSTEGTAINVTCNTLVTGQYVDIEDVTALGTATWNLSAITGSSGDLGGNTGITFTTPANQYWIAHTGTWGVAANWGTTSGGTGGRVPLPQDTAIFDANSFNAASQTVTVSGPLRLSGINSSAATNSPTFALGVSTSLFSFGSVDWSNVLFTGTGTFTLAGRGSYSLNLPTFSAAVSIASFTGTYTLSGIYSSVGSFSVTTGTFNTANYNMSFSAFLGASSSVVATYDLGTSTVTSTLTAGTVFNLSTGVDSPNAYFKVSGRSASLRTFDPGANGVYGTLEYNVTDSIGVLDINFDCFIENLIIGPGSSVTIDSAAAVVVANPQFNGVSSLGYVYTVSQYFLTDDHADFDITDDLDLIVKIRPEDWTPSSNVILLGRNTASNLSYQFSLTSTGALSLGLSTAGATFTTSTSSTTLAAAISIVDYTDKWVRVTRRRSDGRIQFFYGNDGIAWTQLGTNLTGTTAALFTGTSDVAFGAGVTGASPLSGRLYRAIVKNGIDGTIVADLDLSTWVALQPAFTMTDAAGKVWVWSGNANKVGDGRVKLVGGVIATYLLDPPTSATLAYPQNRWQLNTWTDAAVVNGYATGGSSAYPLTVSSAALSISGDLDVAVRVRLTDWTPTARQYFASKVVSAGTPISWRFGVETSGALRFVYTADGTTQRTATSNVVNTITNATDKWVRVTYESATGNVKFYLGDDGSTWVQLGVTQVITAGSICATTGAVRVGHGDGTTTGALLGRIYEFTMKNGIDGTTVAHFNFAERTPEIFQYLEVGTSSALGGGFWVADHGLDDGANIGWFFEVDQTATVGPLNVPTLIYIPNVSGGLGNEVEFVQRAGVVNRLTVVVREAMAGPNSSSPIPLRGYAVALGANSNPVSVPNGLPTPASPTVVGMKAGRILVGGGSGFTPLPDHTAGDLILVLAGWGDVNSTVLSATASTGTPFTLNQQFYNLYSSYFALVCWTGVAPSGNSGILTLSQLPNTFPRGIEYIILVLRNYNTTTPVESFQTSSVQGTGFSAGTKTHTWPSVTTTKDNSLVFNAALFTKLVGGVELESGDAVIGDWANSAITGYSKIIEYDYFPGSFSNDIISLAGGTLVNHGSSGASTATSSLLRDAAYATIVMPPRVS